jgi:cell division protein FtsB
MLRRVLLLVLVGINLTLLYRILGPGNALQEYRQISRTRAELRSELDEVKAENLRLSRRIRLFKNSTVYRAMVVRTKMGFAEPEEVLYVPLDP